MAGDPNDTVNDVVYGVVEEIDLNETTTTSPEKKCWPVYHTIAIPGYPGGFTNEVDYLFCTWGWREKP